jgi:hypothetical protein
MATVKKCPLIVEDIFQRGMVSRRFGVVEESFEKTGICRRFRVREENFRERRECRRIFGEDGHIEKQCSGSVYLLRLAGF